MLIGLLKWPALMRSFTETSRLPIYLAFIIGFIVFELYIILNCETIVFTNKGYSFMLRVTDDRLDLITNLGLESKNRNIRVRDMKE